MSEGIYFAVLFGCPEGFLRILPAGQSLSSTATGQGIGWRLEMIVSIGYYSHARELGKTEQYLSIHSENILQASLAPWG